MARPPALITLAPELIHSVADELPVSDLKNMRLTCKQLGYLLSAQVLRKLAFDILVENLEESIEKLKILSTGCPAAVQGTRELVLRSLSTNLDDTNCGRKHIGNKTIKKYLFRALSSLKSVKYIKWSSVNSDSCWIQTTVVAALASLPNLQRIDLDITSQKAALRIDTLQGMTEIALSGNCGSVHHDATIDNLAKLIARSPRLASLSVACWLYYKPVSKHQSLHHLLGYHPLTVPPLELRHLCLRGALVRLNSATLPHLRNLVSLDLQDVRDPEDASEDQRNFASPPSEIWKALSTADIWLEKIKIDFVTETLLDYLSSYSGLKALDIMPNNFQDGASSNAMATKFFGSQLDTHIESLESLEICPRFEGSWCFNSKKVPFIAKFSKILNFKMAVVSADVDKSAKNIVEVFINAALHHLPLVETLRILHARPEYLRLVRPGRCGILRPDHSLSTTLAIIEKVEEYRAPPSFSRLPSLAVGGVVFKERKGSHELRSGSGKLRYCQL